ncbi:MAG: hypothetical protein AMS18_13640 [Gemmatimonas sp. SG8_17]|nr:MAG: hypothetical protein AMS18_13640 [Gemmatimonas sp. SG8_17]
MVPVSSLTVDRSRGAIVENNKGRVHSIPCASGPSFPFSQFDLEDHQIATQPATPWQLDSQSQASNIAKSMDNLLLLGKKAGRRI